MNILDCYTHRGCALITIDILDLLDFPNLFNISIQQTENLNKGIDLGNGSVGEDIKNVLPVVSTVVAPTVQLHTDDIDDLFGSPKSRSNADDLFSDYKPNIEPDDLFSDYNAAGDFSESISETASPNTPIAELALSDEHQQNTESSSMTFAYKDAVRIGFETRQLIVLKKCIIMRILAVYILI